MGLWEAIFAKALHLIENPLGKFLAVASFPHTGNQLGFKMIEAAAFFPRCHSTPELVGFASIEACGDHGQLDDLFLKNRNTQGAL